MNKFSNLINLAKDSSESSRVELSKKTSLEFLENPKMFNSHEYTLFGSIIEKLYIFIPQEIKQQLTSTIAIDEMAPENVLRTIALDSIDMAGPVLNFSKKLSDETILEVIEKKGEKHHLTVASRPNINEAVTDALLNTKSLNVVKAVGNNKTANISENGYKIAIETSKSNTDVISVFAYRTDIPDTLIDTVYKYSDEEAKLALSIIRDAINEKIASIESLKVTPEINAEITEALNEIINEVAKEQIVEAASDKNQISIDECLKILFSGNRVGFISAICERFKLSEARLKVLLDAGDLYTFIALARACDLDAKAVEKFRNIYLGKNIPLDPEQTREVFVYWIKNSINSALSDLSKKFASIS